MKFTESKSYKSNSVLPLLIFSALTNTSQFCALIFLPLDPNFFTEGRDLTSAKVIPPSTNVELIDPTC